MTRFLFFTLTSGMKEQDYKRDTSEDPADSPRLDLAIPAAISAISDSDLKAFVSGGKLYPFGEMKEGAWRVMSAGKTELKEVFYISKEDWKSMEKCGGLGKSILIEDDVTPKTMFTSVAKVKQKESRDKDRDCLRILDEMKPVLPGRPKPVQKLKLGRKPLGLRVTPHSFHESQQEWIRAMKRIY